LDGIPFATGVFEFTDEEKAASKRIRDLLDEAQVLHDLDYLEASEQKCRQLLNEHISETQRLRALILLYRNLPNADWQIKEDLRLEADLRMASIRACSARNEFGGQALLDFKLEPLQEELRKMRREQMRPADGYVSPQESDEDEDESD
jgi:hypothetical protein